MQLFGSEFPKEGNVFRGNLGYLTSTVKDEAKKYKDNQNVHE